MTQLPAAPNPHPLAIAVAAVLALLAAAVGVTYTETVVRQEKPVGLATAVLSPNDPRGDVNIEKYKDGHVKVVMPKFDATGHAKPPDWQADTGPIPDGVAPFAPSMSWNVDFMGTVARGERPLRFCANERRIYDDSRGTNTAAIGVAAVRAVFDATFEIQPSIEDCDRPDLILGANAGQDCGIGSNAWGCAALQFRQRPGGFDPFVRVTFNGDSVADGSMPIGAVQGVDWHELKHAGDLAHVGFYGQEGKAHGHPADLASICWHNLRSCDNPNAFPAIEDWMLEDGHTFRFQLRPRGQNPQPTPTPQPTIAPTPAPLTKARVLELAAGVYWEFIEAKDRAPTFDEAVAAQLRAEGAAAAYWRLADVLPGDVASTRPPKRR